MFQSAGLVVHRRVAGKWFQTHEGYYERPEEVWAALESAIQRRESLYIVAPGAGNCLNLLGWWPRVHAGHYTIWRARRRKRRDDDKGATAGRVRSHPLIVSGCPDVVGWEREGRRFRIVGVRQFGEPVIPGGLACRDRAGWIGEWFRDVLGRWSGSGCGTWRDTVGAASWATFRTHAGPSPLYEHDRRDVQRLEGRACHGGRAALWCTLPVMSEGSWRDMPDAPDISAARGYVRGPVHRLDVRAMYPTIMRDELFPTRLVNVTTGWTVDKLARALTQFCVIARVRVRSERGELPHRVGEKVSYPRGEWTVTLATPELLDALAHDKVLRVGTVAYYERGRPFQNWGRWILALRNRAKKHHSEHWQRYVKALAVALSGRLASFGGGWTDRPDIPAETEWGEWFRVSAVDGIERRYRSLAGHTQLMQRNSYRPGTLAACYAHVTSYGRVHMARYRAVAGWRACIAQHTDGIVVTDLGLCNLAAAGHIHDQEWGKLHYEGAYRAARYWTPNHFWADGEWTIAGVQNGCRMEPGNVAVDHPIRDPVSRAVNPGDGWVMEYVRHMRLESVDVGARVGPDGWVIAPRVGKHSPPADATQTVQGLD